MVIDFHTHLFHEKVAAGRDRYLSDKNFSLLYGHDKSKMADAQAILKYAEGSGLDAVVCMGFAWHDERFCEEQNLYFSETAKKFPGKILPFGSVPLDARDVNQWCVSVKELGLCGIGEIAFYDDEGISGRLDYLSEILNVSSKLSLPVCLHLNEPVGHDYTGKYDTSFRDLYNLIKQFPDAVIILSHWGGGILFYELMEDVRAALANCYYDTAATPYLYSDKIYRSALDIAGPEKILFGTDYPLLGADRYVSAMKSYLTPDEMRLVQGNNAAKILGLRE